jgi:hypothetical protein
VEAVLIVADFENQPALFGDCLVQFRPNWTEWELTKEGEILSRCVVRGVRLVSHATGTSRFADHDNQSMSMHKKRKKPARAAGFFNATIDGPKPYAGLRVNQPLIDQQLKMSQRDVIRLSRPCTNSV